MMTQTAAPASGELTSAEVEAIDRALIDSSTRAPVMFFFTTALTWLLAATFFGLVASIKMHSPEFLGNYSWLTYGRVWPAFTNTLVYGWSCPVAIGVSIWLMARLCRVALRSPMVPVIGGIFWNIGVTVGVISILAGNMRP
ncbi:MAG: cytochrome c oxidase cbb3-type subunit, partial [Chthoniobacter sp.]|nr:cytochrome c oxidase cbb3-type subunit [Chthoniobacter sp.]